MKAVVIFLSVFLLAGCFFVVKDGDKVKIYGSPKETVQDTLDELYKTQKKEAEPEKQETDLTIPKTIRIK
ncbi:MAG: hypothetical protein AMJ95_12950 [Omnitrophica WOR_2 bacterium SM23_72]|nr:MAG: hypothetical protein AMJ95_12950 [Omnitrophica WOR_2 bacterium SM23_72]